MHMAFRKIIHIDEEKCDGCGLCADACHEGAIRIVSGKAKLVSESYCDGLGDCLGECPQGAITIEEREAAGFDEEAVKRHIAARDEAPPVHACPGSAVRQLRPGDTGAPLYGSGAEAPSRLGHWPVQLMLVPPTAPFLRAADLIVVADCVPFALAGLHERYLAGRAVVVGCPKFDDLNHYYEKLKEMFFQAKPRSITVLRMEVPCCGGIAQTVVRAREETVPDTPLEVHTIGIRGEIKGVAKL
jgi:ferredoxin